MNPNRIVDRRKTKMAFILAVCLERKPVFRLSSIFWLKLVNLGKENTSRLKLTVLDASRVKQRLWKSPYSLLPKFPMNTEMRWKFNLKYLFHKNKYLVQKSRCYCKQFRSSTGIYFVIKRNVKNIWQQGTQKINLFWFVDLQVNHSSWQKRRGQG